MKNIRLNRRMLAVAWGATAITLIAYGAWLIYPPCAFIVVGATMTVDLLLLDSRRGSK